MFKKLVPAVFFIAFLFLCTGPILAEAVVVKGNKIFVADGGLSVLNLDGSPAECSKVGTDLAIDLADITDATDVVIADDGTAVVTVDTGGNVDVETVDVSSCLTIDDGDDDDGGGSDDLGGGECVATADLNEGVMDIPCVCLDGVVYEVHMEQRGNSMNWEVTMFATNNDMPGCETSDDDGDGDGIVDDKDNCPDTSNADQLDTDDDGVGDVCEADSDEDGVIDDEDNCPDTHNPDQSDTDEDGIGDLCEADTDGDGVIDDDDNCLNDANEEQADADADADGIGDACDE